MADSLAVKVLKNSIKITTTLGSKIALEMRLERQLELEKAISEKKEDYNSNTDAYESDPMVDMIQEAYS